MSFSYKNIAIILLAGAVLIFFFIFTNQPSTQPDKEEITVIIDYGDGTMRRFRGDGVSFMKDENAWSVLQRAAASASIPLEVARGFYPLVINGKRNGEEGKRWVLYVNGERKTNGTIPLTINVREGDEVLWKFE